GLAVLGAVGVIFVFSGRPAFGEGTEWRRRRRRERQQVRAAAKREVQVEHVRVVYRVEGALGQERQVLAIGGERRVGVDEPAVGDVEDFAVGQPGQPELAQRTLRRLR